MQIPDTLPSCVPAHYTWHQLDSSKLQTYRSCPREYFYRYVLGWAAPIDSIHLTVGTSWHLAMEHIARQPDKPGVADEAFAIFLTDLRKTIPPALDPSLGPKGPANVQKALQQYVERYRGDAQEFETLHIEVPATATIGPERSISGRMDLIRRSRIDGMLRVFDHKTTSQDSFGWRNQWTLSVQLGTYIHALYCIYQPEEVWGAVIDGAILRQAKTERGTSKGNDFVRVPIRRTPDLQNAWLTSVNLWWDRLERDFALLGESRPEDATLEAFPQNDGHCVRYNSLCPFHAICGTTANPLQLAEDACAGQGPPLGMEVRFWDSALHTPVNGEGKAVLPGYSAAEALGDTWNAL